MIYDCDTSYIHRCRLWYNALILDAQTSCTDMLFCIVTFNLFLHYNKLLTGTYLHYETVQLHCTTSRFRNFFLICNNVELFAIACLYWKLHDGGYNCIAIVRVPTLPWKSSKVLDFFAWIQGLENTWKQGRCLKVLEFRYLKVLKFRPT